MDIPISADVLKLILKILVVTQALKRIFDIPWVAKLIEKVIKIPGFAGGASIALAFLVAVVAGVVQYSADGSLTWEEVKLIIAAAIAAIGGFSLGKSLIGNLRKHDVTITVPNGQAGG